MGLEGEARSDEEVRYIGCEKRLVRWWQVDAVYHRRRSAGIEKQGQTLPALSISISIASGREQKPTMAFKNSLGSGVLGQAPWTVA